MGRRVLVTGVAGPWGSRVAAALERDPAVEHVVGVDRVEPPPGSPGGPGTSETEGAAGAPGRVEFVRTDATYTTLADALRRTGVDTIVHAALVVDGAHLPTRRVHEANVIGTMHLVAAAGQPESRVTTMVVKSSTLVYGAHHRDPVWFREDTPRSAPPRHRTERSLVEVEEYVRDFALDNPHVTLALLRCADVVGPGLDTPVGRALRLPLVPCVGGFDPRLQVVHEDDVVRAIGFVLEHRLGGTYNVAADGLVTWSEVASLCGRRRMPLPPMLAGHGLFAGPMARLGVDLPPELADLLTHGRGVDNRRLRAAGFDYRYTSVGAVRAFADAAGLLRPTADALG